LGSKGQESIIRPNRPENRSAIKTNILVS
jgi:hypothetical protein